MPNHFSASSVLRAFFFAISAATLASCGAATLHDMKPEALAFDANAPTWDNGIKEIVTVRCATCHDATRKKFISSNTPVGGAFDFSQEARIKALKAAAIRRINLVENPMPPNYSTPLSAEEKDVLLKWLALP